MHDYLWRDSPPGNSFDVVLGVAPLPFLSPGDLPNPGVDPGLPHRGQILYHLSHQGSPLLFRKHH